MNVTTVIKLTLISLFVSTTLFAREKMTLFSPDKNISVDVVLTEKIYYSVSFKGNRILDFSPLTLSLSNRVLGENPKIKKVDHATINQTIATVWGSRNEISDRYNEMAIDFEGDFSVIFRAYENGIAYRFVTRLKEKQVTVVGEEVAYRFGPGAPAWVMNAGHYEANFIRISLDPATINDNTYSRRKILLPMFVEPAPNVRVALTEADLRDYPSLFLNRTTDFENFLTGSFERYALTTKTGGFSNYSQVADQVADYLAVTEGTRSYPWRLMVISDDDRTFADNDLVYQLSAPCEIKETSWIKPGKVAWEWWHDYAVEGQPFRGGVNTETYLYQIDFASKYGIEYIIVDWMWTDKHDLTLVNPDVDINHIVEYAKSKNVDVILWCPAHTLHRQLDKALPFFASLGAAGVKVDFFGREDQTGIRMYEDIAKAAAHHKMLVDFHGCTKPTGLSRAYPNIINYEAVLGNEWNKMVDKCSVDHKVMLPFTRMMQGPMDYTPGGLRNVQSDHNIRYTLPLVHGTRSNEMALFVIYNEPLKMLCDAPSAYELEPEITRFITKIPTVWDDTQVLEAKFGEYIVMARKKGDDWYVAGITGSKEKQVIIDFSFLPNGVFSARVLKDGPNADRIGTDYLFENLKVSNNDKLKLKMVGGGGFVIQLKHN